MRQVVKRQEEDFSKPLTETVFLLLLSLERQPLHGYGLMKDVALLSEGRVKLTTGTLYGAIRRLLEDEWIEPYAQEDSSRDKKAYALTALGRRQLRSEVLRLKQLMSAARSRVKEI